MQATSPDLLGDRASYRPKGQVPVFSIATTRRFLSEQMGWSSRKGTKDGQKTPRDWELACEKTFFRFVYTVRKENIHSNLIVNIDQTGVILVPGGNDATYERKGAKQIPIHGKDERRAFTAVLSGSCKGRVLPVQSVWKGATGISLPTKNTSQEAFAAGHRFAFNRDSHWSSLATTKAWIAEILLPYRDEMIKEHHLSADAKMILYLDCWSVHRSKEFREWIKATHPMIIILYIVAR